MQPKPWRGTGTSGRGGAAVLPSAPKAEEESAEEDLNQSHSLRAVATGRRLGHDQSRIHGERALTKAFVSATLSADGSK